MKISELSGQFVRTIFRTESLPRTVPCGTPFIIEPGIECLPLTNTV